MFVLHEVLNDLICDVDRLGFYHFYNKYRISDKTGRSSKELERAWPDSVSPRHESHYNRRFQLGYFSFHRNNIWYHWA